VGLLALSKRFISGGERLGRSSGGYAIMITDEEKEEP